MKDMVPGQIGRLFFRPEGELVNCYIEELKDNDPVYVGSIAREFYRVPAVQEGFIAFCKFSVEMLLREMGLGVPQFGDVAHVGKAGVKQ